MVSIFFKIFGLSILRIDGRRIGNILISSELYLLEVIDNQRKKHNFIWIEGPVPNSFLIKIIKEKINLFPSFVAFPVYLISKKIKIFQNLIDEKPTTCGDRDVLELLEKYPIQIGLKQKYLDQGKKILANKFDISPNSKIVCLVVRDNSYLKSHFKRMNWSYHDYRDSNINNFKKLIGYLTSQNYYVFRMGKTANERCNLRSDKFIDYPFSDNKSDFLDIYLSYRCQFCITTSAGIDSIAYVARKPMLFLNLAPLNFFWSFSKRNMISFKWYYSKNHKKILSFKEIYELGYDSFSQKNEFEKYNLSLIELNEDELLSIIKEFHNYLEISFNKDKNYEKYNLFAYELIKSFNKQHLHSKEIRSLFAIDHFEQRKMNNFFE